MKKLLLASLLLISVMMGFVLADTPITTYSRPNITFTYNESVYIQSADLTDTFGEEYGLDVRPSSDQNNRHMVFVFQPISHLDNQQYFLSVTAADYVNNIVVTNYAFIVNAPFMWIRVTEPDLGISDHIPFDVTIESEKEAYCKYGLTQYGTKIYPFDDAPLTGSNLHHLYNVKNGSGVLESHLRNDTGPFDEFELPLYIECNETETGRIHNGSVIIGYDTNPPSISVSVDPHPVKDPEVRTTTLSVLSNDKTVCTYTTWEGDEVKFSDFDEFNASDYVFYHSAEIDFSFVLFGPEYPYPSNLAPHVFNYTIQCKNRAGKIHSVNHSILVDFEEKVDIIMRSPGRYTKQDPVIFRIETSVSAPDGCQYSVNNVTWSSFDNNTNNRIFTVDLGSLAEGEYVYWARCPSQAGMMNEDFDIWVDRTKPGKPDIDAREPVCSLTRLYAEFDADDDDGGCGISYYNYSIKHGSDLAANWRTTTDGDVSRNVDMEDGEDYKWQVRAVDKAGNKGSLETKEVTARDPNTYTDCDTKDPNIHFDLIAGNVSVIVNISCSDSGSGCTDKFKYKVVALGESCTPTTEKSYGYEIEILETSDLCAIVFDKAGNNKSKVEDIVVGGSCTNGILDVNETDIDCGAACPPCGINSSCFINADCESGSCIGGICTYSGCDDGMENGDETDVDCGGSCGPCADGDKCDFHEDCISGFCYDHVCTPSTCDDGLLGPDEGDIDCGGSCNACENGRSCSFHSDCASGNCINNICADPSCTDEVKNGDETDVDCGGPDCPPCPIYSVCGEDADCDSKNCENNVCIEKKSSLPMWLLIIGIILFVAGLGYMIYSRFFNKDRQKGAQMQRKQGMPGQGFGPRVQKYTTPQNLMQKPRPLSPEERKRRIEDLKKAKDVARERAFKRKQQRGDIMKAFEDASSKSKAGTAPQSKSSAKKAQETKATQGPSGKGSKKKEDFIPLDKLGEEAAKKKKPLKKGDLDADVFQKLKGINPEGKGKPKVQSSTSKDAGAKKKHGSVSSSPSIKPSSKPRQADSISSGNQDKDLSDDDIFDRLANITGASNNSVKKAMGKEKIKREDVMSIFTNVTEKKQLDMSVFKAILSTLLNQGKIDKKEVSSILFEFFDKQLLTKKELYATLKELKLV